MAVLKVVRAGTTYFVIGVLFLLGYMSGQGWFTFSIFSIAFVLIYFVRWKSGEAEDTDWRIYIPVAFFLWAIAGAIWLPSFFAIDELHIPDLPELSTTKGRLKKSGGKRYILLGDGSSLRIVCADHDGKGADNWCLYPHEAPYIDKSVTVFHGPPSKISSVSVAYYELRAGKTVVVDYDDVTGHLRGRAPQAKQSSNSLAIFLTVYAIYSTICLFIRRRATQI